MASIPQYATFFREIMAGSHQVGRACFTELRIDDVTVAITSNLISGRILFGCKTGWHPEYPICSPGMVNFVQIVANARDAFGDLLFLDSCTQPNSYIERLWPDRRAIVEGAFSLTSAGSLALHSVHLLRQIKALITRKQATIDSTDDK